MSNPTQIQAQSIRELILHGLSQADQVEYWNPDAAGVVDFFSADAAEGGEDEFVIIIGDHTHVTTRDLDDAEIKPDGSGFTLAGSTYDFVTKTPINILNGMPRSTPLWKPESCWDTHPDYPLEDWQNEVANDDSRLGYIAWVNHQMEIADDENAECSGNED